MAGILTLTGSPVTYTEPLTASEVKAWLRVSDPSPADAAFDAEIDAMIQAAREKAEVYQNRDLVTKQWDKTLDSFPSGAVELRYPLQSVDLVTRKDSDGNTTTMVENTDYIVDLVRGLIMPPYGESWPSFTEWPSSAITIRFTSGGEPSGIVKIGMLHLIESWFTGKTGTALVPYGATVTPAIEALLKIGARECLF